MQIVSLRNLESYWHKPSHRAAEGALKAWFAEARLAQWSSPQAIKDHYANASIVGNNRIVFNIKGNDYRLIVAIAYKMQYISSVRFNKCIKACKPIATGVSRDSWVSTI